MSDGAHIGVNARRALDTILGGEPPPSAEEQASAREVEARLRALPLPGEGPGPWERVEAGEIEKDEAYALAADLLARAFLELADERPELLTTRLHYPDDYEIVDLRGKDRDEVDAMWQAFTERWPGADEWLGGASGFMVGWAFNAVRFLKHQPPAPNPALIEVELPR